MPERDVSADRRGEERSDCALNGKIELSDGRTIHCIVKDLSMTGVRISIDAAVHVPDRFDLLVPAVPEADQRFAIKLVWRNDAEIGGEFIPPSR